MVSLFGSIFGSAGSKYSKQEHQLSEYDIRKLVSHARVHSLDQKEEGIVESAIAARRHGDGKISLFQIYEALTALKNQKHISIYDRDTLMRVFSDHFNSHSIGN